MFCVALEISLGVGGTAINYQKSVQHGVSDFVGQQCWTVFTQCDLQLHSLLYRNLNS